MPRPRLIQALVPFTKGAIVTTLLLGCRSQEYKAVSLQPGGTPPPLAARGPQPLRVGLAPILSAQGGGEGLAALCAGLSRRLGRPVVPLLGSDYREINDMLGLGQLDVGIVCSGAYEDPRLCKVCGPLLIPQLIGSGSTYQSYIVVRDQQPARRLEDLRGASFEFTDSLSLTGYIYPVSRLCELGQTPGTFFSKVAFSHSHDRSLAMVLDGSVVAAAVDSSVFKVWRDRHPEEAHKLRILDRSEPFPSPPIVVENALPATEKEALRRAFLDLADTEEGKAILLKIGWTGFQAPDAQWQLRMDHLMRLFRKLRAKNCLAS
jgi:phosphonate transport system substrate-binding protein